MFSHFFQLSLHNTEYPCTIGKIVDLILFFSIPFNHCIPWYSAMLSLQLATLNCLTIGQYDLVYGANYISVWQKVGQCVCKTSQWAPQGPMLIAN